MGRCRFLKVREYDGMRPIFLVRTCTCNLTLTSRIYRQHADVLPFCGLCLLLCLHISNHFPSPPKPYPKHLKVKLRLIGLQEDAVGQMRRRIQQQGLYTVCQEASCPNLGHCWSQGTATFMILGDHCTRRCGFCNVMTGRPLPVEPQEPEKLAAIIAQMQLSHAVITSVDRDDLPDCGSSHFAQVITAVRKRNPKTRIEVLIPDFKAKLDNLQNIWDAKPDIINHNVETVPSLYKSICPQSNYQNSLTTLGLSSKQGYLTKSGIILGLGETFEEVCQVIDDLAQCSVQLLTIGQYLQPSPKHTVLKEYVSLDVFSQLKDYALAKGIGYVESGPLVRSSYHAKEGFEAYLQNHLATSNNEFLEEA